MNESLLHYVWQFRLFNQNNLRTTDGRIVRILHQGYHNHDAGPDFSQGKIQIEDLVWAGPVELHVKSSDWYAHKHQHDKAYNHVILHVVFRHDKEVIDQNGHALPTLELDSLIEPDLMSRHRKLMGSNTHIACHSELHKVHSIDWVMWKERLMIERLESKSERVRKRLERSKNDWATVFYTTMASAYGLRVNSDPMEELCWNTPLKEVMKLGDDIFRTEALFLGQSGLLKAKDEYSLSLFNEYQLLKQRLDLPPIKAFQWKYSRMRPQGFPDMRIVQFISLCRQLSGQFLRLLDYTRLEELKLVLSQPPDPYWETHFRLGNNVSQKSVKPGANFLDRVIINGLVPLAFSYGRVKKLPETEDLALNWLEQIASENNKITRLWDRLEVKNEHAGDSQALIQLYNNYCVEKKCLECAIGFRVMKPDKQ